MERIKDLFLTMIGSASYGLHIRKAGKYKFYSNYQFEAHRHPEMEINYIETGSCIMEIDGAYISLKAGECIVIHPHIQHSFMVNVSKTCAITQLEYSMEMPEAISAKIPFLNRQKPYFKIENCGSVCSAMENVSRCYREYRNDMYFDAQLDFAIAQMYCALSYHYEEGKKKGKHAEEGKVEKLIRYMQENLETPFDMESLSRQFHVSSRYVRKYFEKHIGMGCSQYITMLRIHRAKDMLWNTKKSASEIAMQVGFGSSQYFSRVFLQHTGMTPLEYRNTWKGETAKIREHYGAGRR